MESAKQEITNEYITYIIDTYSSQLIRLCYTYLKNHSDAEDITQDVFIELIKRAEPFEDKNYEKAWLYRIAINKCKNHLKSSWHRTTGPLEEDYLSNEDNPEYSENIVLNAILALPEKYRTVIHLFYYNGYSIKEISEITGINQATIGTRLARGRDALKKSLEGEFDI